MGVGSDKDRNSASVERASPGKVADGVTGA